MTRKKPAPAKNIRRLKGAALGRELGVTPHAIYDFIRRGIISRDADGLIDVELAKVAIATRVRSFGKTAAAVVAGGAGDAPAGRMGPSQDTLRYQRERAMREQEDRLMARTKRLQLERRLIDKEATLKAVFTSFRTLRDQVMPVGRRLAARLATMTDARDIQQAIDSELRLVLQQFAEKTLTTAAGRIAGPDSQPVDRDWIEESTEEAA